MYEPHALSRTSECCLVVVAAEGVVFLVCDAGPGPGTNLSSVFSESLHSGLGCGHPCSTSSTSRSGNVRDGEPGVPEAIWIHAEAGRAVAWLFAELTILGRQTKLHC